MTRVGCGCKNKHQNTHVFERLDWNAYHYGLIFNMSWGQRERERGPIWPFDVELRISFWRWSRFSYELWKIWGKWLSIPNWNWKLSQLIVCSGTYEKWVMPQRDYPKPPTLSLVYVIECIVHGHINLHGVEWAWDGVSTNSSLRKMRTQWTTHSSCYNLVNL